MFACYDKCNTMVLDNHINKINFEFVYEAYNYEDCLLIETGVTIGDVDRGWYGDITLHLIGYDVYGNFQMHDADADIILRDVLCISKTFESPNDAAVVWKYKFLKH